MSDRFMHKKETTCIAGYSIATLYREIKKGRFPPPYRISDGRKAWSYLEVMEWLTKVKTQKSK